MGQARLTLHSGGALYFKHSVRVEFTIDKEKIEQFLVFDRFSICSFIRLVGKK